MEFLRKKSRSLGIFQVAVLSVIHRLPGRAYGTAITEEICTMTGDDIADAQVYVALGRLEQGGFLVSRVDVPELSKRLRGRPRKLYALTVAGRRALENAGAYTSSTLSFRQSSNGGRNEGETQKGPMPSPVVG